MRTASSESSSSQRPLGPAQLAASGAFARALAVAARLGLADLTATQARTSIELAAQTGTDPQTLALLLRTLAMAGVFDIDGEGRFGLSEAYQPLRGDHPQSQRHVCILVAETYDDAFAGLLETVRSGRSGFRPALGTSLYDYLAAHPDAEAIFDEAMAELARPVARAIAARPGFAGAAMAIDIGGGSGAFLRGLLDAHPHLRGICLDRPSVCARARRRRRAAGVPRGRRVQRDSRRRRSLPGQERALRLVLRQRPETAGRRARGDGADRRRRTRPGGAAAAGRRAAVRARLRRAAGLVPEGDLRGRHARARRGAAAPPDRGGAAAGAGRGAA
ncbi:hypothetical protein FE772_17940 [Lysobacter enzymogenes]|nr:hypothetical protein FE772_17940 [Lysobacter enzymogenes]